MYFHSFLRRYSDGRAMSWSFECPVLHIWALLEEWGEWYLREHVDLLGNEVWRVDLISFREWLD